MVCCRCFCLSATESGCSPRRGGEDARETQSTQDDENDVDDEASFIPGSPRRFSHGSGLVVCTYSYTASQRQTRREVSRSAELVELTYWKKLVPVIVELKKKTLRGIIPRYRLFGLIRVDPVSW